MRLTIIGYLKELGPFFVVPPMITTVSRESCEEKRRTEMSRFTGSVRLSAPTTARRQRDVAPRGSLH